VKVRHIPTLGSVGRSGFGLCGRPARWLRVASTVRQLYDDPRNREGTCKDCLARYDARAREVQAVASLEERDAEEEAFRWS